MIGGAVGVVHLRSAILVLDRGSRLVILLFQGLAKLLLRVFFAGFCHDRSLHVGDEKKVPQNRSGD